MRAQLEHLLAISERDNEELLVLPTAIGAHDWLVGAFPLLDFAVAQPIVYVEIVNGAVYVQDQQQGTGYARIVYRLRAAATAKRRTGWRNSTYSDVTNGCVEVDFTRAGAQISLDSGHTLVFDEKRPIAYCSFTLAQRGLTSAGLALARGEVPENQIRRSSHHEKC